MSLHLSQEGAGSRAEVREPPPPELSLLTGASRGAEHGQSRDTERLLDQLWCLRDDSLTVRRDYGALLRAAFKAASTPLSPSEARLIARALCAAKCSSLLCDLLSVVGAAGESASLTIPAVTALLAHKVPEVRDAALDALQSIGPAAKHALPVLFHLYSGTESGAVQTQLLEAAGRIDRDSATVFRAKKERLDRQSVTDRHNRAGEISNSWSAKPEQLQEILELSLYDLGAGRAVNLLSSRLGALPSEIAVSALPVAFYLLQHPKMRGSETFPEFGRLILAVGGFAPEVAILADRIASSKQIVMSVHWVRFATSVVTIDPETPGAFQLLCKATRQNGLRESAAWNLVSILEDRSKIFDARLPRGLFDLTADSDPIWREQERKILETIFLLHNWIQGEIFAQMVCRMAAGIRFEHTLMFKRLGEILERAWCEEDKKDNGEKEQGGGWKRSGRDEEDEFIGDDLHLCKQVIKHLSECHRNSRDGVMRIEALNALKRGLKGPAPKIVSLVKECLQEIASSPRPAPQLEASTSPPVPAAVEPVPPETRGLRYWIQWLKQLANYWPW